MRRVVAGINRWTPMTNFDQLWSKHTKEDPQDSSPLVVELDILIANHQTRFGPASLSNDCYRLSEEDAGKHPSQYVHYFYYLWQEYVRFAALVRQDGQHEAASCKWKSFAIIPQIGQRVPFVELGARGIVGLAEVSKSERVQGFVKAALTKYRPEDVPRDVVNAVEAEPFVNWLKCAQGELEILKERQRVKAKKSRDVKKALADAKKALDAANGQVNAPHFQAKPKSKRKPQIQKLPVRIDPDELVPVSTSWATQHQEDVFDLFFSCYPYTGRHHSLLRKTDKSKHLSSNFESLISTDGQQAKIHYSTTQQVHADAVPECAAEIDKSEFDGWIAGEKMIISVDPGHHHLITAVRHFQPPCEQKHAGASQPTSVSLNSTRQSRNSKKKQAYLHRQHASQQSVYQLSNKSYYERAGFTSANRTRDKWRKEGGLKDLDLQLSRDWETCGQRTWNPVVYQAFTRVMAQHWLLVWNEISMHKYQKLRFATFQKHQRVLRSIPRELCGGRKPSDCVVLWGNGSFGPTLRGHASAPNKMLVKACKEAGIDVRGVDEYKTSKTTACCFAASAYSHQRQARPIRQSIIGPLPEPRRHKLHALLYCSQCTDSLSSHSICHHHTTGVPLDKVAAASDMMDTIPIPPERKSTPWNRDVCSAINIFHRAYYGSRGAIPLCFARPSREDEVGEGGR
jgi:hypothetical protein